jgi:alkanesulfonate monooxygenase SsuD/methylene tetrahydromethanopterin reductase-like flavin-dependent oxidoreductase (luciferase family)
MTVEFGLLLTPGPAKGQPVNRWMDALEASMTPLTGSIQSLWMSDHMFWEDVPTYEAWTVLAYIAARWPQFKVAPSVLGQSYRNPALLAKMSATLQILSNGRFIMGIGAGWKEDEYQAYGYPFPAPKVRLEQLEDTLEILRRMWTESGKVTYHGKQYHVVDGYCEPKPNPVPPIVVGGGGRKTKLLAARYADWWNLSDATITVYNEHLIVLKEHCEAIGRDLSTLRLSWLGRLGLGKTEAEAHRRALSLGMSHYKGWTVEKAFVGTPSQVVEKIEPFIALGVDYFIFEIIGLPDPDVIGMLIEDVLPKVRKATS